MLFLTAALTITAFVYIPCLYHQVLDRSQVRVECKMDSTLFSKSAPVWFKYEKDSIYSSRAMSEEDQVLLISLVNDSSRFYNTYISSVNKLAYQSNISQQNYFYLLLLTLCFVMLGCNARTFYDYIGNECFKGGQDMDKWWPWYLYRPLICAPIAAFMIVAIRTSLFRNLFTAKDLSTYLIVSFLAGFAIMEFLTMLRRTSKTIFDSSSIPKKEQKESKKDAVIEEGKVETK